jgi:hypothetical protein
MNPASGNCFARSAIRCCSVDMDSECCASGMFPSLQRFRDSAPPSLPRVPTGTVPRVRRYYEVLRPPVSLSPRFVAFAWRYHALCPSLCSLWPRHETTGLGLVIRTPLPEVTHGDVSGSPRFLRNPCVPMPCSPTPAGPTRQALRRNRHGPRTYNNEGSHEGFFRGSITRLQHSLSTLRPRHCCTGRKTRFPLLATLRDGIGYPQDSTERFPICFLHLIPLSQACLAQCKSARQAPLADLLSQLSAPCP